MSETEPAQTQRRKGAGAQRRWFAFGGCVVVAFLLYAPTLRFGFVWDDNRLIVTNSALATARLQDVITRGFWFNPDIAEGQPAMSYYRPLTNLTFLLTRRVFGLNPLGFHLVNVLLNCTAVMLACLLLFRLFGSVWLAVVGGLILGIHPTGNSNVAYISACSYVLTLPALLGSFWALTRSTNDEVRSTNYEVLLFSFCFLLALLSLEAALAYVAVVALWLVLAAHHPTPTAHRLPPTALRWSLATVVVMAAYLLLRLVVARVPFPPEAGRWALAEPLRVLNGFGHEALLFFFPFTQKVIRVVTPEFTRVSVYTLSGVLLLVLPLALVIWRRSRLGAVGYVWGIAFMLPSAHLMFLGPTGRSVYLAGFGWLVMVIALVRTFKVPRGLEAVGRVFVAAYAVALAVQLELRNPMWKNDETLHAAMVREAPQSPRAYAGLADALARTRPDSALALYDHALALDPTNAEAHTNRAVLLGQRGDYGHALQDLRTALILRPGSVSAQNNLAAALLALDQPESALAVLNRTIELQPRSAQLYFNRAMAERALGNQLGAEADLRRARELEQVSGRKAAK